MDMTIGQRIGTFAATAVAGVAIAAAVSLASDDRAPQHRPSPKHRREVGMFVVGGLAGSLAGVAANQTGGRTLLGASGIGIGMAAAAAAMLFFDRD